MIEGHTFVDAYFIDEDRITLESVWFNPTTKTYTSHIIVAEEGDAEWEKFLNAPIDNTGRTVTLEDLYERTYIRLKELEEEQKEIVRNFSIADDSFIQEAKGEVTKQNLVKLLNLIFTLDNREDSTDEENKERLFLLKLATFEWDKLKDADKNFKKNIRKAKDVHEVLSVISNHLKK
tara:strand:- start:202 stop:732 length:531 start_codon:yes stop_codon:yes gene_type:complete